MASAPRDAAYSGVEESIAVNLKLPAGLSLVTLGPLWGRVAAAELLDGVPDPRLIPYRPARLP
jgi:hypothetical protein